MNKKLEEIVKLKKEFSRRLREEGKTILIKSFQEIFDKFPQVERIFWDQYWLIPSLKNQGQFGKDRFCTNLFFSLINKDNEAHLLYIPNSNNWIKDIENQFQEVIKSLPNFFFTEAFGNNFIAISLGREELKAS